MAPLKILVIRHDNIGDVVCTTPLLTALRQRYPSALIAMSVNSYTAPIVSGHPALDEIFIYRKAKHVAHLGEKLRVYWQRLRAVLALRARRFDYAILAGRSVSRHVLRYARSLGARHIVGHLTPAQTRAGDIALACPAEARHEVEYVFNLGSALDLAGPIPALSLPPVTPAAPALDRDRARPLIALHIGAREGVNRWPDERFLALAKHIGARGATVALLWTPGPPVDRLYPGDDARAQRLLAALTGEPVVPVATPSIPALIARLAQVDGLIACDSGAVHMAAALGKPVLGLYCANKVDHWYPWRVAHERLVGATVADITLGDACAAFDRWVLNCRASADATTSHTS